MFWRKKNRSQDLDRIGRLLIRANALSDEAAEAAVSSPYLFERIKARIAGNEGESDFSVWERILSAARFAVPAMTFATVAAAALFWFSLTKADAANQAPDPLLAHPEFAIIPKASASSCYMTIKEQCSLSSDEALTMIFNQKELEGN